MKPAFCTHCHYKILREKKKKSIDFISLLETIEAVTQLSKGRYEGESINISDCYRGTEEDFWPACKPLRSCRVQTSCSFLPED